MSMKHRQFTFERLETREMKAGDVAASMQNGNLYLNEAYGQAGLDNSVLVSQLVDGTIRVTGNGTLTNGSVSRINGAAYQDFAVPGSLFVNFGGGNDLVVIGADPALGPNAPLPTFNEVNINVAAPPPVFSPAIASRIGLPQGPFNTPDNDNVIIWGIATRGSMTINTGPGNDWVYVSNATIGDGTGVANLTINTGSGADTVEVKNILHAMSGNIFVQTYGSLSETDPDVVWFDHIYAQGDMTVLLGGGNDLFHMSDSSTYHNLYLDAGAGNDTATLTNVVAVDDLMAHMGDGDDSLTLNNVSANAFHLLGEGGVDNLTTSNAFSYSLEQTGWEYINGRMQLPPIVGIYPVAMKLA